MEVPAENVRNGTDMIVQPHRIPFEGARRTGEEPAEILHLDGEEDIEPAGPVAYDLRVQVALHELIVSGSLSVRLKRRCVRCAELFSSEIRDPAFSRAIHLTEEEESVDLTPDIREAIILALCAHPVCDSGCKGLCMQCGANLNKRSCDCRQPEDIRWAALGNLKIDQQEE